MKSIGNKSEKKAILDIDVRANRCWVLECASHGTPPMRSSVLPRLDTSGTPTGGISGQGQILRITHRLPGCAASKSPYWPKAAGTFLASCPTCSPGITPVTSRSPPRIGQHPEVDSRVLLPEGHSISDFTWIHQECAAEFLKALLTTIGRTLLIVWDRLQAYRFRIVREYVERRRYRERFG